MKNHIVRSLVGFGLVVLVTAVATSSFALPVPKVGGTKTTKGATIPTQKWLTTNQGTNNDQMGGFSVQGGGQTTGQAITGEDSCPTSGVPEPMTAILVGLGVAGAAYMKRRG